MSYCIGHVVLCYVMLHVTAVTLYPKALNLVLVESTLSLSLCYWKQLGSRRIDAAAAAAACICRSSSYGHASRHEAWDASTYGHDATRQVLAVYSVCCLLTGWSCPRHVTA
jgi:hypothetical protein